MLTFLAAEASEAISSQGRHDDRPRCFRWFGSWRRSAIALIASISSPPPPLSSSISCAGLFSDFLFHRQLAATAELPASALFGQSSDSSGRCRLRVERIEASSINETEFYKRFVDPGVPVVLTQVRKNEAKRKERGKSS